MDGRDYYEVLGVGHQTSPEEIKRAYKRLAIEFHPDRNPDNPEAEAKFKEVSVAYSVLSDADKRARYDRLGHQAFSQPGNGFETPDLGAVADLFEGLFGDVFRRKRGRSARDLSYSLGITFEESASGCEKDIEITRPMPCEACEGSGAASPDAVRTCETCGGRGQVRSQRGIFSAQRSCGTCGGSGQQVEIPCNSCDGLGQLEKHETMTVRLPPGVEDRSVRTVRGAGERTRHGSGDLHIQVNVAPHPLFSRHGADVLVSIPVTFPQAVLGAKIEVPTLSGKVHMTLPEGTPSSKVFRLRGKGFPAFGGVGKGDQLVTVTVEVPAKVNRQQRKLLEQLAEEMGTDTLPERHTFLSKLRELFD